MKIPEMTVNGDGCICIFDKTWRVSVPGTIVAKDVDSWRRASDLPSGGKDHRTFPRGKGYANQGSIPGSLFQPQEPPPESLPPAYTGEEIVRLLHLISSTSTEGTHRGGLGFSSHVNHHPAEKNAFLLPTQHATSYFYPVKNGSKNATSYRLKRDCNHS